MNLISHFQKRLESILDADIHTHESPDSLRKNFEVITDSRLIRGLSETLPEDPTDKAVILFSRLASYFDAGIFLELDNKKWEPQAQFHLGQVRALATKKDLRLSLPSTELMAVLRTPSRPILEKLNLQKIDPAGLTSCLFIKPAPDFSFLLFSSLPDLWLKEHIQLVADAIQRGLYNE